MPKTSQLQIRISPAQKDVLKSLAADAGVSVSEYVLSKALPSHRLDFQERVEALRSDAPRTTALSDLTNHLQSLSDLAFREATGGEGPQQMPDLMQNYVAAVVEQEAARRGVPAPEWTSSVAPLATPHFAWDLPSLRPHLMRVTPAAFKKRRVFVAAPGDPRR